MTNPSAQLALVRQAVLAMPMARLLKLSFVRVEPGDVEIELPIQDDWCHAPGRLQATAVFAAADFAAVAAAATRLAPGTANATVDATLKLLAPAQGVALRATGRVVGRPGLLTTCAADVYAIDAAGTATLCATLLGTARTLGGPG
ncbi:MAG: PaaI family thioesterase [Burkholderiales bacterium]